MLNDAFKYLSNSTFRAILVIIRANPRQLFDLYALNVYEGEGSSFLLLNNVFISEYVIKNIFKIIMRHLAGI